MRASSLSFHPRVRRIHDLAVRRKSGNAFQETSRASGVRLPSLTLRGLLPGTPRRGIASQEIASLGRT
eukprot:7867908-Pyramimonas_sp.AAC.1